MQSHSNAVSHVHEEDMNLVATWLHFDAKRVLAGALAGLMAGLMAMVFAMIMASVGGLEFWFPAKIMGTMLIGPAATNVGINGGLLAGLLLFEILCAIFGMFYAHFAKTNSLQALMLMGLVWGVFSWIFLWNLYFQSFKSIFAAQMSSGAAFPVCIIYGLGLTSVAFFDRALKGHRA